MQVAIVCRKWRYSTGGLQLIVFNGVGTWIPRVCAEPQYRWRSSGSQLRVTDDASDEVKRHG